MTREEIENLPEDQFREWILELAKKRKFKEIQAISKVRGGTRGSIFDK